MISPSAPVSTFGFFSKMIFIFYVLILVFNFTAIAIEQRNIGTAVYETGKGFFLSTQKVSEMSQEIINNKGITITRDSFMSKVAAYLSFLFAISSMFMGIKIIAFLIGISPWGNNANAFYNYSLAIIWSYFIQVFFLLGFYGMNNGIHGFSGTGSLTYYMSLPIMAFVNLVRAIPFVLTPVVNKINSVCNITGIANSSVCKV